MIQSAMMLALGVFLSGLLWLGLTVALVRRARTLTQRRLLAGISVRRAEFEVERDELKARHAVEMHRLEREVSRILDMATAHRFEADVKDRDLRSLKAEFDERMDELAEAEERLAEERDRAQDLERRAAEAGAELRATQHALKLEGRRRAIAEEALDEAAILADKRKIEIMALRAENDALRAAAGLVQPFAPDEARLPRVLLAPEPEEPIVVPEPALGASVVPLPMRGRLPAGASADQSAALVAEATRDLQRLAGEAHADLAGDVWRAHASAEPRLPSVYDGAVVTDLDAHRQALAANAVEPLPDAEEHAESRLFEALAEIRALKRAANQAGE
jgi:hypothetical protein